MNYIDNNTCLLSTLQDRVKLLLSSELCVDKYMMTGKLFHVEAYNGSAPIM